MGDENTVLTAPEAQHFLRRTGFGALPEEVAEYAGLTRGQAADQRLSFKQSRYRPAGGTRELQEVQNSWLARVLKRGTPGLQEKLVLFWHDHFATSNAAVNNPRLMSHQNGLLRWHCRANFKDLVKAIGRDAAMVEFLDTAQNHKQQPNENYARELLELLTLGVHDFAGNENYRQADIVQIARAFSGWRLVEDQPVAELNSAEHDYVAEFPGRGPKVIFTEVGGFGPMGRAFDELGEGEPEIDRVADILFDHTDSAGQNTVARRTARRLLEYFAHSGFADPIAAEPVVDAVIAESAFDTTFELAPLLRAIFVSDAFYETMSTAPIGATARRSIKWPADIVVSTLRMLRVSPLRNRVNGGSNLTVREHVARMGQSLCEPPSVFGWDWEAGWINSSTWLARCAFARDVVMARSGSAKVRFRPEALIDPDLTDPGAIAEAAAGVLGIDDQLTTAERDLLIDYLISEGGPPLDLHDEGFRERKIGGLFLLLLESPTYQVH